MRKRRMYTDMAVEFLRSPSLSDDGTIKYYEVEVDDRLAKKLHRPRGRYSTLETDCVIAGRTEDYARLSDALCRCLSDYARGRDGIMAVGLGNPDLTADALGDRVFKKLSVNRHLGGSRYLCALTPNVLGMTGIESYDIISAVADRIRPDALIAVDSLTAASSERLATAFQVTDSGITPGSGVDNHRRRLDSASLGIPVISVGVPLVVYSSTLAKDYCELAQPSRADMVVTPKDVDVLVEDCAAVIADAINGAFAGR